MNDASIVVSTAVCWYPSPMLLMLLLALVLPLPPLPRHFSIGFPSRDNDDVH